MDIDSCFSSVSASGDKGLRPPSDIVLSPVSRLCEGSISCNFDAKRTAGAASGFGWCGMSVLTSEFLLAIVSQSWESAPSERPHIPPSCGNTASLAMSLSFSISAMINGKSERCERAGFSSRKDPNSDCAVVCKL